MASYHSVRVSAIVLQEAVNTLYTQISAIYAVTFPWVLNTDDLDLPPEGDVRAQLALYKAIQIPRLTVTDAMRDVETSTGPESPAGTYSLPSTAAPITFAAGGPIPINTVLGYQAVGASLEIQRLTLFARRVDVGDDFGFDVLKNDVSILSQALTIPADTNNTIDIVLASELSDIDLTPEDILSYQATTGQALDIALTIWVNTVE